MAVAGGGGGGGVQGVCYPRIEVINEKKRPGVGGQGGDERRIKVVVKMQNKKSWRGVSGVSVGGGGGAGWM